MAEAEDRIADDAANEIDPREFDAPAFQRDPFPLYKRLRDHHPIYPRPLPQPLGHQPLLGRGRRVPEQRELTTARHLRRDGPYEFGSRHVFGPNILEYGNGDRHRWLRNVIAGPVRGPEAHELHADHRQDRRAS